MDKVEGSRTSKTVPRGREIQVKIIKAASAANRFRIHTGREATSVFQSSSDKILIESNFEL